MRVSLLILSSSVPIGIQASVLWMPPFHFLGCLFSVPLPSLRQELAFLPFLSLGSFPATHSPPQLSEHIPEGRSDPITPLPKSLQRLHGEPPGPTSCPIPTTPPLEFSLSVSARPDDLQFPLDIDFLCRLISFCLSSNSHLFSKASSDLGPCFSLLHRPCFPYFASSVSNVVWHIGCIL